MKVIGFCGFPGSGKSTAIEAVADIGKIITMGDVIRNEVMKRNLVLNDVNLGIIAKELRQIGGPDIIAEKCVELIKTLNTDIVIIDGLRSFDEVKVFRKIWKFPIIAIILNEKARYKRLFTRGRPDDPRNLDELKRRDDREINFGLKEVVEEADYKIKNDSTIKKFQKKVRKIFLEILKNY